MSSTEGTEMAEIKIKGATIVGLIVDEPKEEPKAEEPKAEPKKKKSSSKK